MIGQQQLLAFIDRRARLMLLTPLDERDCLYEHLKNEDRAEALNLGWSEVLADKVASDQDDWLRMLVRMREGKK
jgi:hypothetical protein